VTQSNQNVLQIGDFVKTQKKKSISQFLILSSHTVTQRPALCRIRGFERILTCRVKSLVLAHHSHIVLSLFKGLQMAKHDVEGCQTKEGAEDVCYNIPKIGSTVTCKVVLNELDKNAIHSCSDYGIKTYFILRKRLWRCFAKTEE